MTAHHRTAHLRFGSRRWIDVAASVLAACGLAMAGEAPTTPPPTPGAKTPEQLLEEVAKELDVHRQGAQVAGQYHFDMGNRAQAENRLDDAIRSYAKAVDYQPGNAQYVQALRNAEALAGTKRDTRDVYVQQVADQLHVLQQKLWVEAQQHIEEGMKARERGEYADAERHFALAHTRLESLPFADERREPELRRTENLIAETRGLKARQELQEATDRNESALAQQKRIRDNALKIERDRIEAMYARAVKARERREYDESILLLEQILKINRAYEPAHDLLIRVRRERHVYLRQVTADRWDEEHKLLSEKIRTEMLPQLEIVQYSHDWPEIDARRSAPRRGLQTGEQEEWRKAINKQLDQTVTLDFSEHQLVDVVNFLQRITQVNFVVDPRVLTAAPPPVTLRVEAMTLRNALGFIMRLTGLTYTLRDQAIFVSNAEGVRGDLFMKLYDIRDLTFAVQNFPGPDLQIPEPGGTGTRLLPPAEGTPPPTTNEFVEIIQRVVAPQTWAAGGGTIEEFQGAMVVTQSSEVHQQIEELLYNLRNQRGKQIHIKCKFLTVENSLLEEIGVDWRDFRGGQEPPNAPLVPPNATVGQPGPVGAYNADGSLTTAAVLNNVLAGYNTANSLPLPSPTDGMRFQSEWFHVADGLFASAIIRAVEKDRRGNVIFEPDLTLFNGQQAHIVNMNQQAYVADYDLVQAQYDPIIQILSYGTVLDVQAVASADNRYITMTLRPSNAQIRRWRRFGPPLTDPNNQFPGGPVTQDAAAQLNSIAGGNPILLPEMQYHAVRTSVTIPDGGSLVLAGMSNGESARAHSGIPFLSHIPFLGRLFSKNGRQETEIKTLIIVTGDIILFDEIEKSL